MGPLASDDRTFHPMKCLKLSAGSWKHTASAIRSHPQQGPQQRYPKLIADTRERRPPKGLKRILYISDS